MKSAGLKLTQVVSVVMLFAPAVAAAQTPCTVTFRLESAVTAASLQFEVAYDPTDLQITGSGSSVSCTNLAPALPSVTDVDSGPQGVLQAAYIAPAGFTGPRDLLVCDFTTSNEPLLTDFAITVVDATAPSFGTISPLPTVVPSGIDCGGVFNTTTTSTTSTSTTTSTISAGPTECTLEFSLSDAVTLGSLQWEVSYASAPGEFGGSGSSVQCQNKVTTAFGSMQDNEGQRKVTTALISLSGFTGPRLLTRCTFLADAIPSIGDFVITVTDASDQSIQPIAPFPDVVLSSLACAVDTTTTTTLPTCGNGGLDGNEECDDGPANSNAVPGGCRRDCLLDRLCGDGDGNRVVNVTDAQWVLKAAIGIVSPCPLTACDPSSDASVTVSDAQRILFNSVGLLPDLVCALPITLRVDQAVTLGSVSFDVEYGATTESFLGEGSEVVCDGLVGGATATFANDCDNELLTITVTRPGGFTGPRDLAECRFRAVSAKPSLNDFSINVGGATAPGGNPVPPPTLAMEY